MIDTDDANTAFRDVDVALLVGARPRGPGMERKDLLMENAKIFIGQGRALNEAAKRDVKVLVVGNPANTNAYIAMKKAPDLKPSNFTAMMRLDHNRALSQIAGKLGRPVSSLRKVTIWGNHSATQYPDLFQAESDGQKVWPQINDQAWLEGNFIPTVQKRGAAIIDARGASSAASAASAAVDHAGLRYIQSRASRHRDRAPSESRVPCARRASQGRRLLSRHFGRHRFTYHHEQRHQG